MNKLLTAILLVTSAIATQAQTEQVTDTTNISLGTKKILIIETEANKSTERDTIVKPKEYNSEVNIEAGLDVGVNLLLTPNGSTTMPKEAEWLDLNHSRSLSWRLQVLSAQFPLHKNYIKVKTGVGFAWNSYGLKNNVTLQTRDSSAVYAITDSSIHYNKNKFRVSYVTLPLLLQFNSDADDLKFHFTAGVIGGWNMGSLIRQKWEQEGRESTYKRKDDYNINPFTLDATARIGYKNFTLFATYGLTSLFEKNKGPEVYPMTVGLQIIGW